MNPRLIPMPPASTRSKYSAVVVQSQETPARSVSAGIPSTRASIRKMYSVSPGFPESGATVKPQLPAMAVVTPCIGEGVSAASQNTWASKWV